MRKKISNRLCKCLFKIAHCPSRKFRSLALASQCGSLSRLCVRSAARSRVWSPLPARTRLDRTLDWLLHIRSLLGLPLGRKAAISASLVASSLCFFHSIRSSGIHGVTSSSCSCATTSLAPCMHVRMHGHGRQACKAVYQELSVKQACYARRTTAGEQSDGALRRRNSYAML